MLMLLGQRFEESLICCWLVIRVKVLFFVTFYFCSQIRDPRSLSLSIYVCVCVCVNMHISVCICVSKLLLLWKC
jgi:hypothetical protein